MTKVQWNGNMNLGNQSDPRSWVCGCRYIYTVIKHGIGESTGYDSVGTKIQLGKFLELDVQIGRWR